MRIAVAGGTGTVGRHVVGALTDAGHEPVVLARAAGVDLLTGAGLGTALEGVEAVVDTLNVETTSFRTASAFFRATTQRLLGAGASAGVRHHVCLSIVGIDGLEGAGTGYYRAKVEQEGIVDASAVPSTVLRAAQFHDFPGQWLDRQRGPVRLVPGMTIRPVAAREVGEALAAAAVAEPAGRAPDLVGPREEQLVDLARRTVAARGQRCWVAGLWLPGATGRALREGVLAGGDDAVRGEQTFDEWLGDRAP